MSAQLQEVLHIFAGITSRNNDNGLVSTQKSKEGNNNKTEPQSQKPKGNNNYFPLHKLLDGMKSETTSQKAFKELSTMALNLIPAAIVTESLDSIGEFFQVENFFDSISPIATQFSRYATIDGITKKNIYKPILESISALALFVIKRTTNISSAFLRPFSAVFFYGIEMFDEMKSLVIANNNENKNNKLEWNSILIGLFITELQLNTIAPIVKMARKSLFHNANSGISKTLGKMAFSLTLLSSGFAIVGQIANKALKLISKDLNSTEPTIASKIYWQ